MGLSNLTGKYLYYTSILFGIFITLSVNILAKLVPQKPNKIKEFFENTPIIESSKNQNENQLLKVPREQDIFILISTLENGNSLSLNDLKWYNSLLDQNTISSSTENSNMYFNLDNVVSFENNSSYYDIPGVILNKTSLKGPNAFQFSDDVKKFTFEEFTSILIFRIRDISEHPLILYEIPCNTTSVVKDNTVINVANTISISMTKVNDIFIRIDVHFGSKSYKIIEEYPIELITNDAPLLLSLSYKNNKFILNINKKEISQNIDENIAGLTFGALPVIINKSKNFGGVLYSYCHYKTQLTTEEIQNFYKYIIHNLSGMEKIKIQSSELIDLKGKLKDYEENQTKLNNCQIKVKQLESSKNKQAIKMKKGVAIKPINITQPDDIKNDEN